MLHCNSVRESTINPVGSVDPIQFLVRTPMTVERGDVNVFRIGRRIRPNVIKAIYATCNSALPRICSYSADF
jgi:hypothetical protein